VSKKAASIGQTPPTGFLGRLQELRGAQGGLDIGALDATVLWAVTVALAQRRASITLGVTKDGAQWVCQLWDGQAPIKDYFSSTDSLNKHLAAILRAHYGRETTPELEEVIRQYGW
jgi:hypothetical protein